MPGAVGGRGGCKKRVSKKGGSEQKRERSRFYEGGIVREGKKKGMKRGASQGEPAEKALLGSVFVARRLAKWGGCTWKWSGKNSENSEPVRS